ncbi:MAG: DNA repair protein RadC [Burkholderiaceae bacterium]
MLSSLIVRDAIGESSSATTNSEHDNWIIAQAFALLEHRLYASGPTLSAPEAARDYLRLHLMQEPSEVFAAIFLTTQHQVIACEVLFRGTVDQTKVHPRVIVQRALVHNAAALIVAHQHPSGNTSPSDADRAITARLRTALDLIEVRLLDHLVIGKGDPYSFAYHGLI